MDAADKKLYELKAEIIQAVGHPLRLAIVDFLSHGEQCVCDISLQVAAERSNVSRHLAVMLKAGIVDCRKEGLKVYYTLKIPCVINFLGCVTEVLRNQMENTRQTLQRL